MIGQNAATQGDTQRGGVSTGVSRFPALAIEADWWSAVEASGPASLLLIIKERLGRLGLNVEPEDVLQDAMIRAWKAREALEWRGQRAFRSWLLTIIDNTISDLRSEKHAAKRSPGGGRILPFDSGLEPGISATPSKVASYHEQALLVQQAIESLPQDVRDIVSLRIIHQRSMTDIASSLGLSLSTVQHRLRRGAMLYRDRLRGILLQSSLPPTAKTPHRENVAPTTL